MGIEVSGDDCRCVLIQVLIEEVFEGVSAGLWDLVVDVDKSELDPIIVFDVKYDRFVVGCVMCGDIVNVSHWEGFFAGVGECCAEGFCTVFW